MRLIVVLRYVLVVVIVVLASVGFRLLGVAPLPSSAAPRPRQMATPTEAPPGTPTEVPPSCAVAGDKVVSPTRIMLGDQATITLSLRPDCEGVSLLDADVMIVIDRSGSMTNEGKLAAAKAAASRFVDILDPALVRIGLLTFTGDVELRVRLTSDYEVLRAAIKRLDPIGDTDMAGGLRAAGDELLATEPNRRKILILLTDGHQEGKPGDPVAVAQSLKASGIEIYALGLGKEIDTDSLQKIASDPTHYYAAPTAADLDAIYQRIGGRVLPALPSDLLLDDDMGADIHFVPGSAVPPATEDSASLHWSVEVLPSDGLVLTYTIQPDKPGLLPTNVKAIVSYDSPSGVRHRLELPVPVIEVVGPSPTPTATGSATPVVTMTDPPSSSPPPSMTSAPTSTQTPTPTSTPTNRPPSNATVTRPPNGTATGLPTTTAESTPTAARGEPALLYLPLMMVETCPPRDRFIDVVMVLDASTSMLQTVESGRNKLDVAKESARVFLQGLRLRQGGDRVAIVTFNTSAETLQGLTFDRDLLEAALPRVVVRSQSRLELGIAMANLRLLARPVDRSQAIVVLSDGKVNPSASSKAIAAAETSRVAGVEVYVVGFGPDLDEATLRAIARTADRYLPVPDPTQLVNAFRKLSHRVPCSPSAYWGRR